MESSERWSWGAAMTPLFYLRLGMSHGEPPPGVCCEVFDAPSSPRPWMHYWWVLEA